MPESYEIRIRKEALKFASSHMTVFPDGTKESLHGHHYQPTVSIHLENSSTSGMISFSKIKSAMKMISDQWDEKVLLATQNPHWTVLKKTSTSLEFSLCKKRYVLPIDEVVLLPVDNITCENLARIYFEKLKKEFDTQKITVSILGISVFIEESPGQGAAFHFTRTKQT